MECFARVGMISTSLARTIMFSCIDHPARAGYLHLSDDIAARAPFDFFVREECLARQFE